jgi:hypothetical protein
MRDSTAKEVELVENEMVLEVEERTEVEETGETTLFLVFFPKGKEIQLSDSREFLLDPPSSRVI